MKHKKGQRAHNIAAVCELYHAIPPEQIASRLNLSVNTIYAYASLGGVSSSPMTMPYAEKIEILKMRLDGVSYGRIADRMGYSKRTVQKLCERCGLPRRVDKWPIHKLIAEARKHLSFWDFMKANPTAYQAARKKGAIEQLKDLFN